MKKEGKTIAKEERRRVWGVCGGDFTETTLSGLGVKKSVTARIGVEGNMVIGYGLKVFLKITTWKVSKKTGHPFVRGESHVFSLSFFLVWKIDSSSQRLK